MSASVDRLTRQGVVADSGDGCATIEVGVPCDSCRQAGCVQRRDAGRFSVPGALLPIGDRVAVSLARRDLTAVCLKLFGPGLAWMLALAVIGSAEAHTGLGTSERLIIGLTGLGLALYMGRRLVSSDDIVPEIRLLDSKGLEASGTSQTTVQEAG